MEYSDSSSQVEQPNSPSNSLPSPPNSQIVLAERGVIVVEPKEVSQLQTFSKPKSRKLLLLSLLCTGTITALIAGILRLQYTQTHEATDKAYVATDTYAVNSRIPGQVVSVTAAENQVVKKGSVLVKLNPSQYQAKVKEAQITVEQAQQQVKKQAANVSVLRGAVRAKIKNLPKIVLPGQNDAAVVAARSEVKAAQSELKRIEPTKVKSELDYERFIKLQQSGFIPLKTLEQARMKYESILKQYNSSVEKVKLAQAKLTTAQQNYLDGQIKLAQQKKETTSKNFQEAQANLQQKFKEDTNKIIEVKAKLQQKIEANRKNFQEAQANLQQLREQDTKKLLLAGAKLQQKPDKNQSTVGKQEADQLKAELQKIEKQKVEQLKASQRKDKQLKDEYQKVEQQNAKELKANEQKAQKLKADYEKAVQQLEKNFKSQQEQENKTITRLTEQKALVAQQASSELLLLDYAKSQLYLKTAQAALKQAQVQLKDAQYQLYYTKITAPNNGRINIKRTQTGQKVEPGQTLMSLVPQKPWIAADFDEEQLKRIKPGQSVQIQLKALTDKTFTGKVQSVLPPSKTQYYHLRPPVKISFDPQTLGKYKSLITPGTPASVKVEMK